MYPPARRVALAFVFTIGLLNIAPALSAQRTFVSTSGVDNPACSLSAPCRQFAAAITATAAGGEVIVLDSGGYGKVTITQSVSIIAPPGVYGGISVFAPDDGVTVAAGVSDKVVLRGLTINGQGGNDGIVVASSGEVHIEHCTVANNNRGIVVSGDSRIYIRGTIVRSNTLYGLDISGPSQVSLDDSQVARNGSSGILMRQGLLHANRIVVEDNLLGINATAFNGNAFVTITDSVLSGNAYAGARAGLAVSLSIGAVEMKFVRTTSTHNQGAGFEVNTSDSALADHKIVLSDSAAVANGGPGVFVNNFGVGARAIVSGSTLAQNGGSGVEVLSSSSTGVAMAIVSGSTLAGNLGSGVRVSGGGGTTANVSGSTLFRNVDYDLYQENLAVLLSSGNNALTGRGAGDIFGTITPNPLK